MLCLGRHWNPLTYRYEDTRSDYDGRPAPPMPSDLAELAERIAVEVGHPFAPDVCILNFYPHEGRLGLHQDRDERPETLRAGVGRPIQSDVPTVLTAAPRVCAERTSEASLAAPDASTTPFGFGSRSPRRVPPSWRVEPAGRTRGAGPCLADA